MMSTTKRHSSRLRARVGATLDGRLTAMDFTGEFNTGAYACVGFDGGEPVPVHAGGPYVYDAYRARTVAIHTNGPPSGAFRGFGVPQSTIAQECLFDELADAVGMDRLEFRHRNALTAGVPTVTGQVFASGIGYRDCLEALRPHWERARAAAAEANADGGSTRTGVGLAGMWYGCGNTALPNPSTIKVGLRRDGRIALYQGAVDMGQGANTVMTQICADAVGVDMSHVVTLGPTRTPRRMREELGIEADVHLRERHVPGGDGAPRSPARLAGASQEAHLELDGPHLVVHDRDEVTTVDVGSLDADQDGLVAVTTPRTTRPRRRWTRTGKGSRTRSSGSGRTWPSWTWILELAPCICAGSRQRTTWVAP